jgi:thioesterase domain-containing protein/acyl carrier protein
MELLMNDLLIARETLTFLPAYEPPQSDLEQEVATLLAEHFKVDKLGRDDDFFDLGGDSLAAVALAEGFEQRFAIPFQSGSLIEYSTVSALASLIGELVGKPSDSCPECLTAVQTNADRKALFYVHGALGITFVDKRFLELVGSDQPFYFFHLPGLDVGRAPFDQVEELAAHYIDAMRQVQPEGPYAIAANCACCLIGFEMALQLTRAGEQVSTLLLIDPGDAPPGYGVIDRLHVVTRRWKKAIKRALKLAPPDHGDNEMLPDADWDQRVDDFAKSYLNAQKKVRKILDQSAREDAHALIAGISLAEEAGMAKALTLLRDALVKYRPGRGERFVGRTDMVVSEGRLDHIPAWRRVLGEVVVHRVPGSHADIFKKHLDRTATAVKSALERGSA